MKNHVGFFYAKDSSEVDSPPFLSQVDDPYVEFHCRSKVQSYHGKFWT